MELRAKFLETRDPVALWRDLTTTNRGNCTTRGSDTPMTRRQKASCSEIPDGYPASHADSFDTELGHSPGHSNAFDSRASNSQAEATGSHRCRHGWHPR